MTSSPPDQPDHSDPPDTPGIWRTPAPPPEMPKVLQEPAHPRSKPGETGTDLVGMGRAWGVALNFVFTILGGTAVGWLIGKYQGHSVAWVMGCMALAFVIAFIQIIRATMRDERKAGGQK